MPVQVSLIVTVEEHSPYFRRLLSSVDEQTLQQTELIVVSSAHDERIKQDMELFQKKDSIFIEMQPRTPMVDMMIQGIRHGHGDYIVLCDERFFFESFAMEMFYKQACEQDLDILHFQMSIVPESGVTDYQARAYADRYVFSRERLTGSELLIKAYLQHSISSRMEGKVFRRQLLERSLKAADKFGCHHSEALWIYAASFCEIYQGGSFQKCANLVLRTKDVLKVGDPEFQTQLMKREMCNSVRAFLETECNLQLSQEKRRKIADLVYENALKSVITLWGSSRFSEKMREVAAQQIMLTWGARDMLCAIAMWLPDSRAHNCRYLLELFSRVTKTDYRQMAVFGGNWLPFEVEMERRWVRLSNSRQLFDGSSEETVILLPEQKGPRRFYLRFDSIQQAIEQYKIDVIFFQNTKAKDLFDILTVLACGAHVILDERNVTQLLPIYRQNDANSYMDCVLPMLFANAVMLSPEADVTHFDELGIRYVFEGDMRQTTAAALYFTHSPMSAEGSLYLERLLRRKYFHELAKAYRELGRFRYVTGPYSTVLFRNINVQRIRNGIRNAVWREKFSCSPLLGKCKLLAKTALRLLGFKKLSLGLQNYCPQSRITFRQRMKKLRSHARLFLNWKDFLEAVKKKRLWAIAREKRISPGKENSDKTFYLVRLNPGNEGLLLSYLRLLRELDRLDKTRLIPVIDMRWAYYVMAHNSKSEKGRVNGWERYFRPVAGYTLEQAYRSKNVIRGQLCYREQVDNYFRNNILKENTPEAEQEFRRWCRLDRKYMGLQEGLREEYEREYKIVLNGKRTIGVMIREGYSVLNKLNYALIANHAVQPEMEAVVSDVAHLLDEWDCDQVFISAEYEQTIDVFRKKLGDKVVFTKRERKNFDANNPEEYRNKREEYYKTISREQINYDYLKEVYLLSRCTCLLAGRASASIVAALWNNGKYEHRYIYDLGTYTVSNSKPVVTLEDKQ